jgi:hypothetical protein
MAQTRHLFLIPLLIKAFSPPLNPFEQLSKGNFYATKLLTEEEAMRDLALSAQINISLLLVCPE